MCDCARGKAPKMDVTPADVVLALADMKAAADAAAHAAAQSHSHSHSLSLQPSIVTAPKRSQRAAAENKHAASAAAPAGAASTAAGADGKAGSASKNSSESKSAEIEQKDKKTTKKRRHKLQPRHEPGDLPYLPAGLQLAAVPVPRERTTDPAKTSASVMDDARRPCLVLVLQLFRVFDLARRPFASAPLVHACVFCNPAARARLLYPPLPDGPNTGVAVGSTAVASTATVSAASAAIADKADAKGGAAVSAAPKAASNAVLSRQASAIGLDALQVRLFPQSV